MIVPMTPVRILNRAAKLYGKKVAVVDGDLSFTYSDLHRRASRVAHAIQDVGVSNGGRVAVLDFNTYRYVELYFGMAQSGRVLLPLNIRLNAEEYTYILQDSAAELLIFHANFKPVVEQIRNLVPNISKYYIAEADPEDDWITGSYEDLIRSASSDPIEFEPLDENGPLNLYYTSGTTGNPKGVILTHRNIYANALTTIITFGLKDSSCWHHIAPLFHLADAFFVWSVTYQGGRHVMQRQFHPKDVLQTFQREGITCTMMVPTMINLLLEQADLDQYDLSALNWVMVGGAPMSPAKAKLMMQKLGCRYISAYGLTETSPLLAAGPLKETLENEPEEKQLSYITRTGMEVVGVELRVVDDEGRDVPWDGASVGEIIVRGDNVTAGYWMLPGETENAMRGGFFHTGDLATIDPEGYTLIVDRAKDIIISGGENIASVEVENALYAHPAVLECAVVAEADEKWGEVPKAVVALKPNTTASAEELIDFCRGRLAKFKLPRIVQFVNELPKTGSGKILKRELRRKP